MIEADKNALDIGRNDLKREEKGAERLLHPDFFNEMVLFPFFL